MSSSKRGGEPLSSEGWRDVAEKYMDRASSTLEEARLMAESGHWHASVNRLYYACFYGASALLAERELAPKTHRGTHSQFFKYVVNERPFPAERSATIRKLAELRNESDYDILFDLDPTEVKPLLSEAETLVDTCDELLSSGTR